jgi:hypothetical protein
VFRFLRLKEATYHALITEPNHSNEDNTNNGRREVSRHFKGKKIISES